MKERLTRAVTGSWKNNKE